MCKNSASTFKVLVNNSFGGFRQWFIGWWYFCVGFVLRCKFWMFLRKFVCKRWSHRTINSLFFFVFIWFMVELRWHPKDPIIQGCGVQNFEIKVSHHCCGLWIRFMTKIWANTYLMYGNLSPDIHEFNYESDSKASGQKFKREKWE